ncbi:MAG: hypothetical protein PVI66_16060 [Candidatus Aminicenantes bacterium]
MKKLTIVITCKLDDTNKARIAAADPAIEIVDASQLHGAEQEGDFNHRDEFDRILARTDVTYGLLPPKELVKRAPNLNGCRPFWRDWTRKYMKVFSEAPL